MEAVVKHVFLNGHKWFSPIFHTLSNIIVVDGAYDYLLEKGIKTAQIEKVAGDFDSIKRRPINEAKFLHLADQNYTDFEKTVMFLLDSNITKIKVYFAEGGEADHFFGNLHVAAKYHGLIDIDFIGELQHYCYVKESELTLRAMVLNKIISVIPLPKARVSMTGVLYPLENEALSFANRLSIRNTNIKKQVKIKVKGEAVIFFDKTIAKFNVD